MGIQELVSQYNAIREQEKIVASKKKEIATQIKDFAIANGTQDAKGNSYYTSDDWVVGDVVSTSVKFNQEKARAFFENRQDLLDEVTETVTFISEDKVVKLVADGILTLEDVESMSDVKQTHRVDVRQAVIESADEEKPKVTCKPRVKKLLRK